MKGLLLLCWAIANTALHTPPPHSRHLVTSQRLRLESTQTSPSKPTPRLAAHHRHTTSHSCVPSDGSSSEQFAQSFITQKNFILLEKLQNPENGNLTATAQSFVNFCDESFDIFLGERIATTVDETSKTSLGKIRYEINRARQAKLLAADRILRDILSAGGLKQMEAKLAFYLRRSEIDMAFTVILRLNIEDAINANVTTAVQVMTHLETLINEHQDALVTPPVKLLRLLVRTEDPNVRRQMLRQKLIFEQDEEMLARVDVALPTASPQCEHIVVEAVKSWGGKDVRPQELEDTITDVRAQMCGFGEDEATRNEMEFKCQVLLEELREVLLEATLPRVSDACEDDASLQSKLVELTNSADRDASFTFVKASK